MSAGAATVNSVTVVRRTWTGAAAALVLTAEATADDVAAMAEPDRPDFVVDRVDRVLPGTYWKRFGWEESRL